MEGKNCPVCGKGALKKIVKDKKFKYKGYEIVIKDYIVYKCPTCKEAIIDNQTLKSSGKILKEWGGGIDNPPVFKIDEFYRYVKSIRSEVINGEVYDLRALTCCSIQLSEMLRDAVLGVEELLDLHHIDTKGKING